MTHNGPHHTAQRDTSYPTSAARDQQPANLTEQGEPPRSKTVLISGASIAGPTLAYWLHRYGFSPTIIEREPALRPGGYKVDIRGAAMKVIERMGLLETAQGQTTGIRGGMFLNGAGKTVATVGVDLIGFRDPGDLEVMRGDLAQIIYDATRDTTEYLFGDSITSIEQHDDGVLVGFEHGEPRTFDLVVGADGLHSNVRALAFGPEADYAHSLGLNVAIYSLPNYLKLDRWELAHSSAGHVTNVYSTQQSADAKVLFFFPTPARPYDRRDIAQQQQIVAEAFAGHGWEVPRLLSAMPAAPDFYFDALSQIRMAQWSAGRVVLLGDAGYCPSPASGQGTSMALVGAYVLAGALAAANGDHHAAFANYERELRGYVELNQQLGRDIVKQLVPSTKFQAWMSTLMLRLLPYMPGKSRFTEKIMEPIRAASNGINLKDPADSYKPDTADLASQTVRDFITAPTAQAC